ncbi:MAG: phosphatidylglycerophosphatase A [Nitrospirota bacterium]
MAGRIYIFIATGGYAGYSPIAPGTVGSLVGVVLYWVIKDESPAVYLSIALSLFFAGIYVSNKAEKLLGIRDSPKIVIDEVVGYLYSMFLLPAEFKYIAGGFIIFRLIDILKPYPIRLIERKFSGGFGIMVDDFLAAVYTNLILQIARIVQGY